jgi:hypothetical protein
MIASTLSTAGSMPVVAMPASNLATAMGNVSRPIEKVAYVAHSKKLKLWPLAKINGLPWAAPNRAASVVIHRLLEVTGMVTPLLFAIPSNCASAPTTKVPYWSLNPT